MRFGGHETFAVRPNWLSRGMLRVEATPISRFDSVEVADSLGVGRNMARAIGHWLEVTGLIERSGRDTPFAPTALGRTILTHDPYLQRRATWWALHTVLVTRPPRAWTWHWFFNNFDRERFDRVTCLEALALDLERRGERLPAAATLNRDVACLLQSYAVPMPAETVDPEDATDCPFRQLGLVIGHRDTGVFERRFTRRRPPPALLGLILSLGRDARSGGEAEIPFAEALTAPASPGRVLALDGDGLAELVEEAEATLGSEHIRSYLLGAERMIGFPIAPPENWLEAALRPTEV